MSKFTKTLVTITIAGLISSVAYATDTQDINEAYVTDGASIKMSGAKCDTEKENNIEIELVIYNNDEEAGPNSGFWESDFFTSTGGPWVSQGDKTNIQMGFYWHDHGNINSSLNSYGDDFCDEDFDGVEEDETTVKKFETKINKRHTMAKATLNIVAFWYDSKDKKRKIKLVYKTGRMEID